MESGAAMQEGRGVGPTRPRPEGLWVQPRSFLQAAQSSWRGRAWKAGPTGCRSALVAAASPASARLRFRSPRRVEAEGAGIIFADLRPIGPASYALPRQDDRAACKQDLGCSHRPSGLERGGPTLLPSCVAAQLSLEAWAAPSPGRPHRHSSLHDPSPFGLRRAENNLVVGPRMACRRACDVPVVGRLCVYK